MEPLLTRKEVCEQLGIGLRTLNNRMKKGEIEHIKTSAYRNSAVMFTQTAVDEHKARIAPRVIKAKVAE